MKSLNSLLTVFLCSAFLAAGCKPDNNEQLLQEPSLEITSGDIVADPSGQECSIEYTLKDKVDGGSVSAECPADWVSGLDYSEEGSVTFTVMPNDAEAGRNTFIYVIYTYGDGDMLKDSVAVTQSVSIPEYDYEYETEYLTGVYYGTKNGKNGEYSYYVTFSDMPYGADGYGQPGGTYYVFDLFGPAPEDPENPMVPMGIYTLGEPEATAEYTFTPELSGAFTLDANGQMTEMYAVFAEGEMELAGDGNGNYTMVAELVDNQGKKHRVEYSGNAGNWRNESLPPYGIVDGDIDFTATSAKGEFIKASGQEMMFVKLSFSDMQVENGSYTVPGNILDISGWVPFDMGGSIGSGTYEITSEQGVVFSIQSGMMYGDVPDGTHVESYDENSYPSYGMITSGTMKLANWSGYYEITWDFTTEEGNKITGSYNGEIKVDMPKEFSTLEGDITLDLSNVEAIGTYYGDWYVNGGGNWQLTFRPPFGVTEGDGMQIDLVAERLGFDAGIPSGTYTAGGDNYPEPAYPEIGEYRRGFLSNGFLSGTGYMGGFDGMGHASELAPATSGDLVVTAHGDGTYTLEFSFLDDKGNTWDGEWTGVIQLSKYPFAGDIPESR